jgi:hypothetical protein
LIGAFKLDPNRVCDLVLEAAERDLQSVEIWLRLMNLFNKDAPMLVRDPCLSHTAVTALKTDVIAVMTTRTSLHSEHSLPENDHC